jgi:hypothetical protein
MHPHKLINTERKRVILAAIIGGLSAVLSWAEQTRFFSRGGDFLWSMMAGADLLAGRDPYRYPPNSLWIPYPLPAAFVGLPFSFFPPAIGAGLFFGLSSGLLAYVITKDRYDRLWMFLAMPFWFALFYAQWAPLIMAAAFIPALLPVVLIKPQIALPVGLTHLSRTGIYCCVAVLLLSVLTYPTWPLVWLSQIRQYQKFFPVLAMPFGPLLLLALLRWRDKDAQLLLLASVFPERYFYDSFILWLIPKTRSEVRLTALLSWGTLLWRVIVPSASLPTVVSAFCFLPMLSVILLRRPNGSPPPTQPSP